MPTPATTPSGSVHALRLTLFVAAAMLVLSASAAVRAVPNAVTAMAIEFYNPLLRHYFVTADPQEIAALDAGHFVGWYRTGQAFGVFADASAAPVPTTPVCRFYIPPEHGDSHFFSASPAECAAVVRAAAVDPNFSGYVLESSAVFDVVLPDVAGGCPAGTVPLYRLWNGRADSNHRYTVDPAIKAQMIRDGFVAEGSGPDAVAMCVPPVATPTLAIVSGPPAIPATCNGGPLTGTLYLGAEVEPRVDSDPRNPAHLVAAWQQDRWSDGGARGIVTAVSNDGGRTWTRSSAAFTRCTGGEVVGANYDRTSDPWVTFSPDGTVHEIAIAFSGPDFGNGATNAVLVSTSHDGGLTWGAPTALIRDVRTAFNDKETITADPADSRFVYAVWDRIVSSGGGPTWFARTTDGGATWEPARSIYDPGTRAQTLDNQVIVLPDGTLVNCFTLFQADASNMIAATFALMRSTDRGLTWSAPVTVATSLAVGVTDPADGSPVRDAADIASIAVGPDGRLALAWQDSRFSGGLRDAIAFSQSVDGGLTWSPPVRINAVVTTQAFVPTVKIRDDGVIGVTYYDLRNDTPDPTTLPSDYWLAESSDGITWHERHVSGPFDVATAPVAEGYFLGDYQGLAAIGAAFVPVFARTTGSPGNATDIVAALPDLTAGTKAHGIGAAREYAAPAAPAFALTPAWRERTDRAARATLARRLHGSPPGKSSAAPS